MSAKIVYWSVTEDERLTHTDRDDAILLYLDTYDVAHLPATITVTGYARMNVSVRADLALERVLEVMDEEYGDPDGDGNEPTPAMIAAAETFARAIEAEYVPWWCVPVHSETVDVLEWVREHEPQWLDECVTVAKS